LLQVDARALVAAMLRPHDREDAELDQVRLAAEGFQDPAIFFVAEPVLGDHFGSDAGGVEYVHAAAPSRRRGPSLDVVPQELLGGENERLRAAVEIIGERTALGRPAFVADAPEIFGDLLHRHLGAEPELAAALDDF